MMFESNLNEFSAESTFTWSIKNITNSIWMNKYVIKSTEMNFYDDNASTQWFVKLSAVFYDGKKYFAAKFFLRDNCHDENAKYKFDITLNGKNFKTSKKRLIHNEIYSLIFLRWFDNGD